MQDVLKDGLHLFSAYGEELTLDEVKRYDRQIILLQIGNDGQKFVMDGLTINIRVVKFPSKNKNYHVCGEHANIKRVKENCMEYVGTVCSVK